MLIALTTNHNVRGQRPGEKKNTPDSNLFYLPAPLQIDSLSQLSRAILNTDSDQAFLFINRAIMLADEVNDSMRQVSGLITLGDINYALSRYDDALESYRNALAFPSHFMSDTLLANLYESIGLTMAALGNEDAGEDYLSRAVDIYHQLGLEDNIARAYMYMGSNCHLKGKFSQALDYYEKSLGAASSLHDQKLIADVYNSIGIVYYELGSFEEALEYYSRSLEIVENLQDTEGMAFALNNIGIVYYDWGNLEKALEYYQQSLEMDKQINNDDGIAGSYNNIGIIYSDWDQNELAIDYYRKSLEIYEKLNNFSGIADAKNNIGESYAEMGRYEEALKYLMESLELEKTYGNRHGTCQSYNAIAELYFKQGEYQKALQYNSRAAAIAVDAQLTSLELLSDELFYKIYKAMNNPARALASHESWVALKDSVYNMQFQEKIASIQLRHELDQRQKEQLIDAAAQQKQAHRLTNQRIYLVIIFVLMLIFGFLVYYDIRSKTMANRKLATVNHELEKQRDKLTQILTELTKSEQKYKNLVQNAPTGILYLDRDGKILEVNPTMLKILGSPGEEETKKINCLEYPPLKSIGMADDIKTCMETGETLHKEYEYTTKWGREVFLSIYMTPILSHSGEVTSVIVNAEDVTISRKAERMIQKSEKKYRMLVENSLQAMMIIQKGRIVFANSKLEELSQYAVDHLINLGRQWLKVIIHPDDLRMAMHNVKDALDGKDVGAKNEYRIIRKDGSIRWIETLTSTVDYLEQPSLLVVAIDITDRKEAETFLIASGEKLKQANAMKDKFFSIVAHDLKNPFNAILGFSNLLNEAYDNLDTGQRKSFIKNICEASENTFKLLQNLLDWSRTQTGNIDYHPGTIDLSVIANDNIALLQSAAVSKKIRIIMNIPFNTTAWADENMVKTVVRNLLSNAIKFTPNGGRVELMAEMLNGEVMVCVVDNGVGVAPENLPRLFRIDEQFKSKGTDNETGTGLGLILCKELVEKNNGRIWAESKPDEGSRFCFTLPVTK